MSDTGHEHEVEHTTGFGLPFSFACRDGTVVVVTPLPPEAAAVYAMGRGAMLVTVLSMGRAATGGHGGRPSITTEGGGLNPSHVKGRPGWDRLTPETLEEVVTGVNRGGTPLGLYRRELRLARTRTEAFNVGARWHGRVPREMREGFEEALYERLDEMGEGQ